MMVFWIAPCWWAVGFVGAIISGYCLPDGDEPFTWGRLISCSCWAFAGPLTLFTAIIWGAMLVSEGGHSKDSFLNKPIFKRRGN